MAAQYAEVQFLVYAGELRDGDQVNVGGKTFTVDTASPTDTTANTFPDSTGFYDLCEYHFGGPGPYTVTLTYPGGGDAITIKADQYGDSYNLSPVSVTPSETYIAIQYVKDNISPLAASATIEHETSPGNGSITLDVSGGTTPYTYAWSNGATTKDISGLTAGEYTVTIDSDDGQQITETYTVLNQLIVVDIATTDVTCNGGSNGTATLTVSGGTSPYTYSWSDGATTKDRTDLPAGTHSVTVTDSAANYTTKEVVINEPTAISILAEVNGQDIDLTVSGGTPPYSYAWSDDATVTTQDRTGLDPGDYTVTVTDANSCSKQATITIAPFTFYFSDNPILLSLAAADPATKPNLSFICDVYIEKSYGSGTYEKVISSEQPADSEGKTTFDVQELVGAYISEDLPDITKKSLIARTKSFKRFYLSYTEKYGDPPVAGTYTQQDTFYCLLGGLSVFEHARKKFFDWLLPNKKPFWSWWPAEGKDLYTDQVEYLHYMVNKFGLTSMHLKVKFTYTDGTTFTDEPLNSISTMTRFEVYRIPVSYEGLGIPALPKEVKFFTLWMEDEAANVISELRTYNVKAKHPRMRQFFYLNSLGSWDTLTVTERATAGMQVKSERIMKRLLPGYAATDSEEEVISKTGAPKYRYGMLLKNSQTQHLLDFALSRRVFEVRTFESSEVQELIPVRISCEPGFLDEVENYNEFVFDVVYPETTKYTPLL